MKHLNLLILILSFFIATAQPPSSLARLTFDATLEPFYHGVASGDPLTDAVIIWTRVTTQDTGNITVSWEMATDTLFNNIVQSGTSTTSSAKDYTLKVDVTGLLPASFYYYQFKYDGRKSLIGRTKTAPVNANHLRFAVVSCADFENGYFNAYEHITFRNDIDAVLHLGDYIYEYEVGGLTNTLPGREHEPPNEIISLTDYRLRYSHYRLDAQLRGLHQQYPFITTWDDHETANNSWFGGAGNHTPGVEGDWFDRKNNGKQAYFEWLPIRESVADSFRVYRKFRYSDLADIIVLDTRLEGRDEQNGTNNQDPNRTILGIDQYNWFINNLKDSTTQWKIVAQQVMLAPLGFGQLTFNEDQWDGYPAERTKLYGEILNNNIENFVVLTGDIHTSWANDLPGPNYNALTGAGTVGVEFVTTSITTVNADIIGLPFNPSFLFPHVKWANLVDHGYLILNIDTARVQADWVFVNTIDQIDPSASAGDSWYVNSGERNLQQGQSPTPGLATTAPLAPLTVDNTLVGIEQTPDVVILGSYPNPFWNDFIVQYFVQSEQSTVVIKVISMSGQEVYNQQVKNNTGVNYAKIGLPNLATGQYLLQVQTNEFSFQRQIVKVN